MTGLLTSNWILIALKIVITGVSVLIILVISVLVILLIKRKVGVILCREHSLNIQNIGNLPSVFHLSVNSPQAAIKFQFRVNDTPLSEVPYVDKTPPSEQVNPSPKPLSSPPPAQQAGGAPSQTPSAGKAYKDVSKSGQKAVAKTGQLATFLGTLGSLIPGSAGKAIKEQGNAARAVQVKTAETMRMPDEALRKTDALKKEGNRAGVGTKRTTETPFEPQGLVIEPQTPSNPAAWTDKQVVYRVQTPEINPGETLLLSIRIVGKDKRLSGNSYLYTIISQQVPLIKLDKEIPFVSKIGTVYFERGRAWRYWFPTVAGVLVVVTALLGIMTISTLLWL